MNTKKIFALFLSAIIIFSALPVKKLSAEEPDELKTINTASDWAKKEIKDSYASIEGFYYMPAIYTKDFKGDANREEFAELAVVIYEIMMSQKGIDVTTTGENPFIDSDKPYVIKANHYDIIKGVSKDKFDPYGNLTREQLCTILYRMIVKMSDDKSIDSTNYNLKENYKDANQISPWALKAVKYMNNQGIIAGYNGILNPKGNVTREQAIALTFRTLKFFESNEGISNTDNNTNEEKLTSGDEYRYQAFDYIRDNLSYDLYQNQNMIAYEGYKDFDGDGKIEATLVLINESPDLKDYIVYAEFDSNSHLSTVDVMECTNSYAVEAKMIKIDCEKEELLVLYTELGQASGFVLYDLSRDDKIYVYRDENSFPYGVGLSELKDTDGNGVIDSYTHERFGLDVLYFPIKVTYKFIRDEYARNDYFVEYVSGFVDCKEYPNTPEEVVKNYIFLSHLKVTNLSGVERGPYPKVKGLDERIDLLSKTGFNSARFYVNKKLLENTALELEPKLLFKSDIKGNTAVVTSEFSGNINELYEKGYEEPLYTYYLVKENGKWRIESIK